MNEGAIMFKRIQVAILAAACILAMPTMATAQQTQQPVEGVWTYAPASVSMDKMVGQQLFISGRTVDELTGSFAGTGDQQFTLVHHMNGLFNFYRGVTEFEGTVWDAQGVPREGTMTILTVGKQDPGLADPSGFPWEGTWVITAAAGGLEGLHGHGTFSGPSLSYSYEGMIHFTQ